ncbi:hypothetical protein ACFLTM_04470 [Candidatus Bipolaricaulota bacterium]
MTITTAIAAMGLMAADSSSRSPKLGAVVHAACEWLATGVTWETRSQGACPWFGSGWPDLVNNVASKTGKLLLLAGMRFNVPEWIERAGAAAEFVCSEQRADGGWIYALKSERSPRATEVIDAKHTAYIIEGLLEIAKGRAVLPAPNVARIESAIDRGLAFVDSTFCGEQQLREKVWILTKSDLRKMHRRARRSRAWPYRRESGGCFMVLHPEEPRLWSLGELLTLHAHAREAGRAGLGGVHRILERVAELARGDGRFAFRRADDHVYARHEAHVFAGLADLCFL